VNNIPAGTEVFADPLIAKVLHNLIDNAVRHGEKTTTLHSISKTEAVPRQSFARMMVLASCQK